MEAFNVPLRGQKRWNLRADRLNNVAYRCISAPAPTCLVVSLFVLFWRKISLATIPSVYVFFDIKHHVVGQSLNLQLLNLEIRRILTCSLPCSKNSKSLSFLLYILLCNSSADIVDCYYVTNEKCEYRLLAQTWIHSYLRSIKIIIIVIILHTYTHPQLFVIHSLCLLM